MNTLTLEVPTIHCRSCVLTIEEALDELDGVTGRRVDLEEHRVTVSYDAATVDAAAITRAVIDAGYAASAVADGG